MLLHLWRSLVARAGLTITVVSSLAIGFAATTILYTVVDAAILHPFPYAEPERLVGIGTVNPALNRTLGFFEVVSGPEVEDVKSAKTLIDAVGFDLNNESVRIGTEVERVFTAFATGDLFRTLGIQAEVGRAFTDAEVATGARVAVISHVLWADRFGADPAAIGKTIIVSGEPYILVGVAPPRARIYGTDLWVPLREQPASMARNRRQLNALARLAPGVTLDAANAELKVIASQLDRAMSASYPEYRGFSFVAEPWTNIDTWNFSQVTLIAFAAVGAVMLLVTTNLASLLLARASGRRRDAAIHASLGASQRRIAMNFLAESMAQALLGAALGVFLAWLGLRAVPAIMPAGIFPPDVDLTLNLRVLGLISLAAIVTAAIVGLVPAFQLSRTAPLALLTGETGRTTGSRSTTRLHALIVSFEVAVAMIVAGAAGLVAVSTAKALNADPGFDAANVVIGRVTLPPDQYNGERSLQFFDTVLDRLRARPDVVAATTSNQPPPGVFARVQFEIEGRTADAGSALPTGTFSTVGTGYEKTLDVKLVAGRWFDEMAPMTAPHQVVVNETLAKQYWPDTSAIGHRIKIAGPGNDGSWADIVGVAADVKNRTLVATPAAEIFGSTRQIPDRRRTQLFVVVRYRGDSSPVVAAMRAEVAALDSNRPVYAVSTLDAQLKGGLSSRTAAVWLLGVFSALAIGLAALGVFGVLSYAVSQRVREIGIRVALGSSRRSIIQIVVSRAMWPLVLGLTAGLAGVWFGRTLLGSLLFGIEPEAGVLIVAAGAIFLIGFLSALRPAWSASRLSPLNALRNG